MIRTQIYLDKKQYEGIKIRAKVTGKSSAEVIRNLIDESLLDKNNKHLRHKLSDLSKLNISGGPKDLASKIDVYLYERS